MPSASPIHSVILMWKCDVAIAETHLVRDFVLPSQISNAFGNEVPRAINNIVHTVQNSFSTDIVCFIFRQN